MINQLLSRRSHFRFGYPELLALLALYTPFSCLAAGTSVASGIVEPMLVIGATMGRVVGVMMVDVFGVHADSVFWEWLDPGAFALIGAAAFFAGVSRLTVSLTVIMIVRACACRPPACCCGLLRLCGRRLRGSCTSCSPSCSPSW